MPQNKIWHKTERNLNAKNIRLIVFQNIVKCVKRPMTDHQDGHTRNTGMFGGILEIGAGF